MPLNPTQPSLNLACAHQHQPRLCKSHVEIFLILIIRSYIVYFFIGFILEGDGLSSWGEPPESPACCTDTVFMSSVCISPAWCSAVRCTVFKCITLCFKVPFHNLWPPTLQHWLSRCLNMLHMPRLTANKHGEMNCMPFTVFISSASRCSLVHHYQTAFSSFQYIWNASIPLNDIQGHGNPKCVCVHLRRVYLMFEKIGR